LDRRPANVGTKLRLGDTMCCKLGDDNTSAGRCAGDCEVSDGDIPVSNGVRVELDPLELD
jgi:hypothetical protein